MPDTHARGSGGRRIITLGKGKKKISCTTKQSKRADDTRNNKQTKRNINKTLSLDRARHERFKWFGTKCKTKTVPNSCPDK